MESPHGERIGSLLRIRRAEWRDVLLVASILFAATSLPYAYAYASAPADRVFMGIALNVPDHAQYFAWLRSHAQSLLISNRMTPEPNGAVFFNLLWWALAWAGRLFGLDYAGVYQLLRAVGTFGFIVAAYRMIALAIEPRRRRLFALLLVCCTSGFGWALVLAKYTITRGELWLPLDVYVAEGNTFLDALGSPHFLAAVAYVLCFELFLRGLRTERRRAMIACGLFAQFMGWQHAYDLLIVWGVLAAFVAVRAMLHGGALGRGGVRTSIFGLALVVLFSCPPALYAVALTRLDPLWSAVLAQFSNAGVWTPPPWRLPILFGFTFLAACWMAVREWARRHMLSDVQLFVWIWFIASFALIYLPTDYQIHMLNGWQIPMAILATRWLVEVVAPRLAHAARWMQPRVVAAAFLVAVVPTNAYLFGWRMLDLSRHRYDFYLTRADVDGLQWLARHAGPDDVVLSSLTIGQYVPMFSDARAYLAHWAQTVNFYARRDAVQRFFSADADPVMRAHILIADSVDYVFEGPAERALPGFDPHATDGMRVVFEREGVRIYATRP